jgi:hypothetical protein
MPTTSGSDAELLSGAARFAVIAEKMTRRTKNLNIGLMIHLPARPKRQVIDQWKSIFPVGRVSMRGFLKQQPTVYEKAK